MAVGKGRGDPAGIADIRFSQPCVAHRSGSGSKVNFGYQQKFQLDMNFWGKSYQKMHNLKISTGGPSLVILGFLAVFGKNRVKNAFYGNLALYFIYIYKI